ncbi:MAG: DUF3618 domain-containing protein [Thermoleophilia bacterium]|nr:DUF3618 domain-containing protein [Thermoleophilia bacterium]
MAEEAKKPDESKPFEADKPFKPEGIGPDAPIDTTPNPRVPAEGTPAPPAGVPGSPYAPPPPKRTSAQIRADIENQRQQLGKNVDHLRDRVTEITDWRGQIKKHQKKIVIGAVATGFVVGGLMALRRR